MRNMWDAAYPPLSPPDTDAVAGYIGGNTPHLWTEAEWARQTARFRLPIFVRSHDGDPVADAKASVTWLKNHAVPQGVTLALDYETRIDAAYLQAFDMIIVAAGYRTVVYGSRKTVLQNPKPSGGYWTATWNNIPHLDNDLNGHPVAATQYGGDTTLGKPYDLSLVADSTPLWDTGVNMTAAEWTKLESLLERLLDEYSRKTARWVDHADNTIPGVANPLSKIREDIGVVKAIVDGLMPNTTPDLSTVSDIDLLAELNKRLAA